MFLSSNLIQVLVGLLFRAGVMFVCCKGCDRIGAVAVGVVVGMCYGGGGCGGAAVLLKRWVM